MDERTGLVLAYCVDGRYNRCIISTQNRSRLTEERIQSESDRSQKQPARLVSGFSKALQSMMKIL
jgi:hypothetical protein